MMPDPNDALTEYPLLCPQCSRSLYIRHNEGGPIDREEGTHFVTNVSWSAECHADECQWESVKRSTKWALIRAVRNAIRSENPAK